MVSSLLSHSIQLRTSLQTLFPHYKTQQGYVVYNVFEYAWDGWNTYVRKCARASARIVLIGINPGPHGMLQTGIPFGTISSVRNYIGIRSAHIKQPQFLHEHRPVTGMKYHKEEQSGLLLWNTIASIFPHSADFFSRCFVINYCPLAFFAENGENITPDKIALHERKNIEHACSTHLLQYLHIFKASMLLAIGRYAFDKVRLLSSKVPTLSQTKIEYIPHPSPLNRKRMTFAPTLKHALNNDLHQ